MSWVLILEDKYSAIKITKNKFWGEDLCVYISCLGQSSAYKSL